MEEEGAQHIIDLTMRAIQDTREQNDRKYATKKDKLTRGDELPPGVLKMVKVYIAERRRLHLATRWPAVTVTRVWSPRSAG